MYVDMIIHVIPPTFFFRAFGQEKEEEKPRQVSVRKTFFCVDRFFRKIHPVLYSWSYRCVEMFVKE